MPQPIRRTLTRCLGAVVLGATALAISAGAFAAMDDAAAKKLLKKNDCLKCHHVDKTKKGPSYKKIAGELRGKPDAEQKIIDNLTKAPKVKLEDGTEEEHKVLKASVEEMKDLIQWILAQ